MTIPVSGGTNTSRADVTGQFRQEITNVVNTLVVWHSGSHPGGVPPNVGDTLSSSTPGPLGSNLNFGTSIFPTFPATSDLPTGAISRSTLSSLMRNAAVLMSRAREVTLIRQFTTGVTNSTVSTQTAIAHMNATWQLASTASVSDPPAGNVDASAYTTFINNLETLVTNHRNSTVVFTEVWCHSNCHSNHSSRNRR